MNNLNTEVTFAGLKLKNPIVISSSGLTETVDKVKILEKCGAGAVVLKSLFEEQIMMNVDKDMSLNDNDYPEAQDFLRNFITTDHVNKYIDLIRDCKAQCSIPIIASINCHTQRNWTDFAKKIEEAGADALEVNIMLVDTSKEFTFGASEKLYIDILSTLKKTVSIPVIIKMSKQFSNIVSLVNQLQHNDVNGAVLFNRPYCPDINIEEMDFHPGPIFTEPAAFNETLRWVGIVSGMVPKMDLAASTGIHTGENLIKILLAGAHVAQICSVIYREGPDYIGEMLSTLHEWMKKQGYENIEQFRGSMNFANFEDENYYERTQFMKYFSNKDSFPPR